MAQYNNFTCALSQPLVHSHRPLISIELCFVFHPPSSSSCTWNLPSSFLSPDLFGGHLPTCLVVSAVMLVCQSCHHLKIYCNCKILWLTNVSHRTQILGPIYVSETLVILCTRRLAELGIVFGSTCPCVFTVNEKLLVRIGCILVEIHVLFLLKVIRFWRRLTLTFDLQRILLVTWS